MKELKKLLYLALMAVAVVSCDDDDVSGPNVPPTTFVESTVSIGGRNVTRVTISDFGAGVGNYTMSPTINGNEAEYVLNGKVYVNDGQTLTIQPGTVVKGAPGQNVNASVLIVAIGGRIEANGTAADPIIFTYQDDDVQNNAEAADRTPGAWGGVVILGDAPTNLASERLIEGVDVNETRAVYGGPNRTNAAHNGGTFRYVSIRNSGTAVADGSELQGLTLGGVGSGTTIEYVESIFSNDDGIEIFGGTVNIRYFLGAFIDDDIFDLDNGWQGRGQFWFGYQFDNDGNRGGEWDGDDETESTPNVTADGQPYATGVIANMTMIARKSGDEGQGIIQRNNAGYSVYNSIIASASNGLRTQYNAGTTRPSPYDHFAADRAIYASNVFGDIGAPATLDTATVWRFDNIQAEVAGVRPPIPAAAITNFRQKLATRNNVILASVPLSYPTSDRVNPAAANVNPVPSNTTGFPTVSALPAGGFFQAANFIGAFEPGQAPWYQNWTLFDALYAN